MTYIALQHPKQSNQRTPPHIGGQNQVPPTTGVSIGQPDGLGGLVTCYKRWVSDGQQDTCRRGVAYFLHDTEHISKHLSRLSIQRMTHTLWFVSLGRATKYNGGFAHNLSREHTAELISTSSRRTWNYIHCTRICER